MIELEKLSHFPLPAKRGNSMGRVGEPRLLDGTREARLASRHG